MENNIIKNNFGSYFFVPCQNPEKEKKNIVFIHGYATTSQYHDLFVKHISNDYNYYALQLPGHGFEELDPNQLKKPNLDYFVDYCVDLIKSLQLDNIYLIGHSMGGSLVIRVANKLEKENKIKAVCSVTPMNSSFSFSSLINFFKFNPKNFKQTLEWQNQVYDDYTAVIEKDKVEEHIQKELEYQTQHRQFFKNLKKTLFSLKNVKDCKENERKINLPLLVIIGNRDKLIPKKTVLRAFKSNKMKQKDNIQIEILKTSGHVPFQEQESEYAKSIIDFFSIY